MDFCPHTENDIKEMLKSIGINQISELYRDIPKGILNEKIDIENGMTELEVLNKICEISKKNNKDLVYYLGAGMYDHFIPSVVDSIASRSEFLTPYTPYQPEASQGTLQALFEYQTMITMLTDMEATNASLYDGSTALAEAMLMSVRITGRNKIIVDESVNPIYRDVMKSYASFRDIEIIEVDNQEDIADFDRIMSLSDEKVSALVIQNPNFFGSVIDYSKLIEKYHSNGSLVINLFYPISLGLLKTPGEMGADIAVADGQSLGNQISFGGPTFGIITCKREFIRNLPGRIVGETVDKNNKRCYVLTLQAREQHIRRQKATSNICSNENLCALKALFYMSAIGNKGLENIAKINYESAHYLKDELLKIDGFSLFNKNDFYNEFVVSYNKDINKLYNGLMKRDVVFGLPLERYYNDMKNSILLCITEKRTENEMERLINAIKELS